MAKNRPAEMTQVRFAAIVAAYGADTALWPAEERALAESWQVANPADRTLVLEADALDRALGRPEFPPPTSALERRLLDDFDRAQARWSLRRVIAAAADTVWPGAPAWQPAIALGLAFVVGLGIVLVVPIEVPQQDEAANSVFALDYTSDNDAGHGI